MLDSKLQSLGSLGSKAKQIVANVAKYFLQESKKETSPASYIRKMFILRGHGLPFPASTKGIYYYFL